MLEDRDFYVGLLQAGLNAAWVLLPLVPAIIIYRIFPDTRVAVSGPLHGLTVRASGAFAAYLIVFLATLPLINEQNANLSAMYDPQWRIRGTVIVQDENGREVPLRGGAEQLRVSLRPDIITLAGNEFEVIVPEMNNRIPTLLIEYPGFGTHAIAPLNLRAGQDAQVRRNRREIDITSPLVIRREACQGPGC